MQLMGNLSTQLSNELIHRQRGVSLPFASHSEELKQGTGEMRDRMDMSVYVPLQHPYA